MFIGFTKRINPSEEGTPSSFQSLEGTSPHTSTLKAYGFHFLFALALVLLPFIFYPQYLSDDALLYPFDNGLSYYTRFKVLHEALYEQGSFPLWQTTSYGGSPFHANPENPSLYPPILILAAFLPPLLALNLAILLHLSLATLGMYVLMLRFWKRMGGKPEVVLAGALVASVFFGFNYFTRMEHFEQVIYGAAQALIPWIFLAADSLLYGASPRRAAGVLALLVSLQIFTGGLYVYTYTCFALLLWFVFLGLLGGQAPRRRVLTFGVLAGSLAILIVLAKILPFLVWVQSTTRSNPIDPSSAMRRTLATFSGSEGFDWRLLLETLRQYTGGGVYLLFLFFALPLLKSSVVRMVVALMFVGFLVALGPPYAFLYEWVPPFNRIRFPFRAWTLVNAFLPVLLGLGVNRFLLFLFTFHPRLKAKRLFATAMGCALSLIVLFHLCTGNRDWREEIVDNPFSFQKVVDRYPPWKKIAGFMGKEGRAVSLNVRGPMRCNEQFISSALGMETVSGFFGYAWPSALIRHAYSTCTLPVHLRRLAILSVRYFTCSQNLVLDTLWEKNMDDAASSIFEVEGKINGERISANQEARPRAFIPRAVGALFGDGRKEVLYYLHNAPSFRADRISFLCFDPDELPGEQEIEAFDEILVIEDKGTVPSAFSGLLQQAEERGITITRVDPPLNPEKRNRLWGIVERMSASIEKPQEQASFERLSSREVRVTREDAKEGRFITLSETWLLYGDWKARTETREIPIRPADGMVCSVYLKPGETTFIARYEPKEAYWGFCLGALGVLVAFWFMAGPKKIFGTSLRKE